MGEKVQYKCKGKLNKSREWDLADLGTLLASIVDSSDDAIIGKTLNGIIMSWNPGATRIYGYSADEIKGKSISILVPQDQPNEVPEILKKLKQGKRVEHYETVRMRKDGKRIHVSLSISPIRNATGKIVGASTIARDISERKKTEETLKEQKKALEEKNIALAQVIAQVEIEKNSIKEDVIANVDKFLIPVLKKIKLKGASKKYVDLLNCNLQTLVSSFGRKIVDRSFSLSTREVEICNMIRSGLTSKEISNLLNISSQTIDGFRKNIRKKLRISNKKVNLTSYLRKL